MEYWGSGSLHKKVHKGAIHGRQRTTCTFKALLHANINQGSGLEATTIKAQHHIINTTALSLVLLLMDLTHTHVYV